MNLKFFSFVYHLVRFSGLHSAHEMGENSAIINSNGGYIQLGKKLNFVKKGKIIFHFLSSAGEENNPKRLHLLQA